jgi:Tfp pilus assembly protein FimT
MGLLLTIGYAYYQNFNRRQIVVQAAKDLKNNLRLAQSKALAGEKPTGCSTSLQGYRVTFSSGSYSIAAICGGTPGSESYPFVGVTKTVGPNSLLFKVLSRGVENPGTITLTSIYDSSYKIKVTVNEGGEIIIE